MTPCRACGGAPGAARTDWRYDERCRSCGAHGIDPGVPVAAPPENAKRRQVAKDLAAARARLRNTLSTVGIEPCGDNSCIFGAPGGMATNGGCRCLDHACIDAHRIPPEARAVELLRPGADRVADRCLHEGEPCPGADVAGR